MTLDVADVLSDGLDRAATPVGAWLLLGLFVARLASTVVLDSQLPVLARRTNELAGERILDPATGPFAVDAPSVVLTFLSVLAAIVTAGLVAVGFRAFTGDRPGRFPTDARNGLAWTTLNVLVAQFVLPGLVVAVAFVFVPAAIAVDGHNALRAMLESWQRSRGERLRVGLMLLGVVGIGIAVSVVGVLVAVLLLGSGPAADVVSLFLGTAVAVYAMGVIASAFDRLQAVDDDLADVDDELLP
jgi:hypothetical protein